MVEVEVYGRFTFEISDWEALNLKFLLHLLQVSFAFRSHLRALVLSALSISLSCTWRPDHLPNERVCVCMCVHTHIPRPQTHKRNVCYK